MIGVILLRITGEFIFGFMISLLLFWVTGSMYASITSMSEDWIKDYDNDIKWWEDYFFEKQRQMYN